jgi:hypothetical protein
LQPAADGYRFIRLQEFPRFAWIGSGFSFPERARFLENIAESLNNFSS